MIRFVWDLAGFTPVFLGLAADADRRIRTLERQGQNVAAFEVFSHPGYVAVFKRPADKIEGEELKGRPRILCDGRRANAIPRKNRRNQPASAV